MLMHFMKQPEEPTATAMGDWGGAEWSEQTIKRGICMEASKSLEVDPPGQEGARDSLGCSD